MFTFEVILLIIPYFSIFSSLCSSEPTRSSRRSKSLTPFAKNNEWYKLLIIFCYDAKMSSNQSPFFHPEKINMFIIQPLEQLYRARVVLVVIQKRTREE